MTQQIINTGIADKGNGDPIRTAFTKVNANFDELYSQLAASVIVGATAPTGPEEGALWWNSENGRMYVYFGTAWVDASPVDGAGISSTNQLVNAAYTTSLGANGVLTLPNGSIINGSTIRGVAGTGELNYTGITIGPNSNDAEKTWMWVDHANAYISTDNSANTWTFNDAGALTFPQGTTIATADGTDAFLIDGAVDKDVQIYTYSGPTPTAHGWTFGTDGKLTLPTGGSLGNLYDDPNATGLQAGDEAGSYVLLASNNLKQYIGVDNDSAFIATNWIAPPGGGTKLWNFRQDGTLELPGSLKITNSVISNVNGNTVIGGYDTANGITNVANENNNGYNTVADNILVVSGFNPITANIDSTWIAIYNNVLYPINSVTVSNWNANVWWIDIGTVDLVIETAGLVNLYPNSNWTFNQDGVLTLPNGTNIYGDELLKVDAVGGFEFNSFTDANGSGEQTWTFGTDGTLTLPGKIAFPQISGPTLELVEDTNLLIRSNASDGNANNTIRIANYVQGVASYGSDITLLKDRFTIGVNENKLWTFGADGALTLPNSTTIADAIETIIYNAINSLNYESGKIGTFATLNLDVTDPTSVGGGWIVNGPGVTDGVVDGTDTLLQLVSINTSTGNAFIDGESYTFTSPTPLSVGSKITVNNNDWTFGNDGQLTVPGAIRKDGGLYMNSGGDGISSTVFVNGTAGSVILRTDNGTTNKSLTFDVEGVLTFPDNLKIAGNKIRNVSVVDDLSSGSEIEVTLAKTVITHGVTNSLGGGGSPSLTSRSIVDVGDGKVVVAHQIINDLGGDPSLTSSNQIEVNPANILIGTQLTNTAGASTLTAFTGWTFDAGNSSLTLPSHGIVGGGGYAPGLTREIYSGYPYFSTGTFEVTTTWFNDGRTPTNTSVVNPATFFWDGLYDASNPQSGPPPNTSWKLTGYFIPPVTGVYEVIAACNDHGWVSINGVNSAAHNTAVTTTLTKNIPYLLTVYFTNTNTNGTLNLQWKNNSTQINYTGDFAGLLFTDVGVEITASNRATWTFGADGALALPQGAVISDTASSPGLFKRKYSGTFVLDPTWFAANAGNLVETTVPESTIQSTDLEVFGAFSFEFTGYFVPPTSANYTFKAHADETFVFWIGAKALSGYTYANKDMYGDFNGTFPEQQTQSFTIALTAGQFYPIRIQWGNSAGWGVLDVFTWANDAGQADTANFSGHIYTADTGTAVVSVSDNKSIVLRTANDTTNNWTFAADSTLTIPGDVVNSTGVGQLANRVEGSWTVTTGTNTYSFTVPSDGTYTMWVKGNIPNGIITWNATLSITNSNVPAIGQQYAWNYTGGGSPILLTARPDQIRGTTDAISTDATYTGTTSNRFDFGISNTSGASVTVYYGYTKV